MRNLVLGFRGGEVETVVACRDGGPLVAACRALGATVHPVPFDKRFRPGPARRLAAIVRGEKIDVVHAHGLVAAFYCVLARALFGVRAPLIYHQHGFHHHNYGSILIGIRKAWERAVCRRVDRVIACSILDRERLLAGGYAIADDIRLVYYGIPESQPRPDEVEAARQELGLLPGRPVVGVVARLHPQKGIDVFLHAARRILDQAPDVAFLIVGGGEIEAPLHALARELGLSETVRFLGARDDFPRLLRLFDVAVLPSRWEGLPIMLLEYLAAGLPIVSSRVDGCLEVLTPREAELVPPGEPGALADAILRTLRDPVDRAEKGRAARERFVTTFGLPVMIDHFRLLYQELGGTADRGRYRVT